MVSSITSARVLQYAMAIIVLGVSGKLTKGHSSLTSLVDDWNDSALDSQGVLEIDTNKKTSVISLLSSLINLVSHPVLSVTPSLFSFGYEKQLADGASLSFTTMEKTYLGSMTSVEGGLNVLYFASAVYQTLLFGNYHCGDTLDLLTQYNLTGDNSDNEVLSNFFNVIEQGESYLNETLQSENLTSSELQSRLLLLLSSDCQLKKASILINFIQWVVYIYTSSSMAVSGYLLYAAYKESLNSTSSGDSFVLSYFKNLQIPKLRKLLDKNDTSDTSDKEEHDTESHGAES